MSVLRNTDDLRADALFRAGEPPTDTTGSFWSKSLDYINRVQQQLLLGGSIAVGRDLATSAGIYAHLVDTPITDWWWARKRGVFNTLPRVIKTASGTVSPGATQITLVSPFLSTIDIVGHSVIVDQRSTVYRVVAPVGIDTIRLDAPYVDDAITSPQVFIVKTDYALEPDFLRFASTPYLHSTFGGPIDVGSIEQRNMQWPLPQAQIGRPTRAFMVAPQRISFNAFDDRAYRCEYEYVAMPADLLLGQTPILPEHHRAVLSAGAAMLIAFDKGDGRAENFASEYRELVGRMVQEHRRAIGAGSTTFGMFRTRDPRMPQRPPQTLGEIYLV